MLTKFDKLIKEYTGALSGPGAVDTSDYAPTKIAAGGPATAPVKPKTPTRPAPAKPQTPTKPAHPLTPTRPGISPKPKAETDGTSDEENVDQLQKTRTENPDLNLFLKNRGL